MLFGAASKSPGMAEIATHQAERDIDVTDSRKQILQDAKVLRAIRALAKDDDLRPHIHAIDKALQKQTTGSVWGVTRPLAGSIICDRCEMTDNDCWDCSGTGIDPIPWAELFPQGRKKA